MVCSDSVFANTRNNGRVGTLNFAQRLVKGKATSIVRKTDRYFVKVTGTMELLCEGGEMWHFPELKLYSS